MYENRFAVFLSNLKKINREFKSISVKSVNNSIKNYLYYKENWWTWWRIIVIYMKKSEKEENKAKNQKKFKTEKK